MNKSSKSKFLVENSIINAAENTINGDAARGSIMKSTNKAQPTNNNIEVMSVVI
jgi:hypothetical protein